MTDRARRHQHLLARAVTGVTWALALLTLVASLGATLGAQSASQRPSTLRIVVIEGEDAVNVVQQRTAVAPVVEVRDRNDQPVAGAIVRFSVRSGRATFNGARTLTMTTNAAGRAAAAGLTPTGTGALEIGASATFQSQTVAISIAQTNVLTATEAAAAGSASGAASGSAGSTGVGSGGVGSGTNAAGAAAGGGASSGGASLTTLGVIGGAAAGGTLVATRLASSGGRYEGAYSGIFVMFIAGPPPCTRNELNEGTVSIDIEVGDNDSVSGFGGVDACVSTASTSGACSPPASFSHGCCDSDPPLTGTASGFSFVGSHPGGTGSTWTYSFSGSLANEEIRGSYTLKVDDGRNGGTATFPVTLRRVD